MRLDIPTNRKVFRRQQESHEHSSLFTPAGPVIMAAFIAVTLVTHKRRSDLHRHCKAAGCSFDLDAQAGRLLYALDRFSVERSHS
jgi:hypothetical protein